MDLFFMCAPFLMRTKIIEKWCYFYVSEVLGEC